MKIRMKTLAVIVALFMFCSVTSFATEAMTVQITPFASDYLSSYGTYMNADGGGKVSVWFEVYGVRTMDEVGALTIALYELNGNSWEHVKTFRHMDYSNMLGKNKASHISSVSYSGTSGKSYCAYVTIWAGKDGKGDTREIYASSVKA